MCPGHAAVEHVDHEHLQADGLLQRLDLVDDLVGGADGLGGAAGRKARIGHTDVGGLALEVFLVAGDALEARVVPFEVVVLGRSELVVEVLPALFGFRRGLGAVHPQQGGGLVRRQAEFGPDGVELPHLRGHLVEVVAGDKHLPEAVLGGQPRRGLGGERRLDPSW